LANAEQYEQSKDKQHYQRSGQQADFGGGGADYWTFESMFWRSQEEAVVVARNLRDRILMLNSILT
jgi:hypothetical protein